MAHLFIKLNSILNLCFSLRLKNCSNNKYELFDEEISKRVKLFINEYMTKALQ